MNDAGAFLDRNRLISLDAANLFAAAGRPGHADRVDAGRRAEPERQRQFALRRVARSRLHDLPQLRAAGDHDVDAGADAIAVRRGADCLHPQHVVGVAAVVAQQAGRAAVGGDQDVEVTVVVVVAVGGAAADALAAERLAGGLADLGEAQPALAAEELAPLGIAQVILEELDVILHVTVGHEQVRTAVVVRVKKEEPKAQVGQVGGRQPCLVGAVRE